MKVLLLQIAFFLMGTFSLFLIRHFILIVGKKKNPRRKHGRRSKDLDRGKPPAIRPAQVSGLADSRAAPKRGSPLVAASSQIDRRSIL